MDIIHPASRSPQIAGVSDGTVTLRVSQNLLEGNTGCHQWNAGFFLAEYVLNHPELVKGEHLTMFAANQIVPLTVLTFLSCPAPLDQSVVPYLLQLLTTMTNTVAAP